jgi:DNA polymerase III epsilon subunit-like protein/8-oxo-dGTP pyrophosphatase MutT (NUDIX family)
MEPGRTEPERAPREHRHVAPGADWGRLGVFDLETTGVDVDTARIVSACVAVLGSTGDVIARWDWLADPGIEIPDGAAAVHGITTERARRDGRSAALVIAEVTSTLRVLMATGMPVVVYNAPYDLSLLDRECRRHGIEPIEHPTPVIDPLVIDKALDRYRKGKRTLVLTAERYGVVLDGAHDAGADAIAAGRVAQALAAAFPDELGVTLPDLHGRQELWYAEQAQRFQEYIRAAKGDTDYVADTSWPIKPALAPSVYQDTMPIPPPEPRPGRAAQLVLEAFRSEPQPLQTASGRRRLTAYASAPPPKRPTVLRVAAGIITDPAGRTLVVRKRGTTAFMQAGGKIEAGESALDALTRELREELGMEIDPDRTEYIGSFRAAAANEADTVIRAEVFALSTGFGQHTAHGEIEELLWLEGVDAGVELAPLTRDTILPLWVERRSALF